MLCMKFYDVRGVSAHTLLEHGRVNMSERAVALYAMLFSRKRLPPNSPGLCRPHRSSSVAAAAAAAQMRRATIVIISPARLTI